MYTANNIEPVQLDEGQFEVNQGKLEGSNIDISAEMVNMITNLRAFQANQRVIQSIDETLAKTVNEVGALK
jgi:flagellar basal-body rod protein FlgG